MKFTKFGHSCLLVEEGSARILFDPGSYSTGFETLEQLDAILITHVHQDHCDIPRLQGLIVKNPGVRVITNPEVQTALQKEDIIAEVLADGAHTDVKGVLVEAFGTTHAEIYKTMPRNQNVGFMVGSRFFHPGDAFTVPSRPVEILGAPVAGPWMKISEGIDYIEAVKPKIAIAIHDGILKRPGLVHFAPQNILPTFGIQFMVLEDGQPVDI
jgi:L-ascorbate metabolism protein UlaG (beta-lactamase superfamily)